MPNVDAATENGDKTQRRSSMFQRPSPISIRAARASDVRDIQELVEPLVQERVLLGKDLVVLYESVQEFRVAVDGEGGLVACGALHVIWEDIGEIRTLAVAPTYAGRGIGRGILENLEHDARNLGLTRLFCLTFEVDFFSRHGFVDMGNETVDPTVYAELVRSPDEGVAEFLDLARVKPNTLGNTRMVKELS